MCDYINGCTWGSLGNHLGYFVTRGIYVTYHYLQCITVNISTLNELSQRLPYIPCAWKSSWSTESCSGSTGFSLLRRIKSWISRWWPGSLSIWSSWVLYLGSEASFHFLTFYMLHHSVIIHRSTSRGPLLYGLIEIGHTWATASTIVP